MIKLVEKLKNQKTLAGLLVILIGFLFSLLLHISGALQSLEMKTLDVRMQLSNKNTIANDDIIVILVDEASLKSMKKLVGRWPWPRSIFGELITFFSEAEARAVLFDVLFTEPQVPRNEDGELGEDDFNLVDSTIQAGNTIHAAQFLMDTEDELNKTLLNLPMPEMYQEKFAFNNIQLKKGAKLKQSNVYYLPFPELYESADQVGIVEFGPDVDGIYRRSHLIRKYGKRYYPVLALSMIGNLFPPDSITVDKQQLTYGKREIPLQKDGTYLINMKKEFVTYSIGGVLASINKMELGEYDEMLFTPEEFQDKIIIIGASAAGIEDLKHTTTGADVPGVLLHASIISNLIDQDYIYEGSELIVFAIVLMACIIITIGILSFKSLLLQGIFPIVLAVVYVGSSYYLMDYYRILIPVIFPLVAFASVFTGSYIYVSATEGKERRKTRKMLSQYVSPHVLSEVMDKSNSVLTPEVGTTEELSILFSDIRSFTSFSEMVEVSQVVEQLNYYLSEMVEAVFEYKGTLDKFIGDAVMAFWGAPIISKLHAREATLASLEM
ncbi:MAG: adenylate/guanylate cyclase domain-containing protein, partial [Deltaproteobacteria bacterium]|nr:adenylate/guanylate cyclase domain-containing protein [Deltaproteobacteria bacterium]